MMSDSREFSSIDINYLPDELLLLIASYLDLLDLINLSRCSKRFYNICRSQSLMINRKDSCSRFSKHSHCRLLPFLNELTKCIELKNDVASFRYMNSRFMNHDSDFNSSSNKYDTCIYEKFFDHVAHKVPNLQSFSLEEHILYSCKYFPLSSLPETLQKLSLKGTQILENFKLPYIFRHAAKRFTNLKVLDISYCTWFDRYMFSVICEFRMLKVLRMVGCTNIMWECRHSNVRRLPPQLEMIDMRRSCIFMHTYSFCQTLAHSKTLKHLRLEPIAGHGCINHDTVLNLLGGIMAEQIETLEIRNCYLNDSTLTHIQKACKSLKRLDLSNGFHCIERLENFKKHRPEIEIRC